MTQEDGPAEDPGSERAALGILRAGTCLVTSECLHQDRGAPSVIHPCLSLFSICWLQVASYVSLSSKREEEDSWIYIPARLYMLKRPIF